MALNRIQKNMIDQDFVKQVDDQAEQLAQKAEQSNLNIEMNERLAKDAELQEQVDNLVLGAVGDGNNAEVVQARGSHPLLNDRLSFLESANLKTRNVISNGDFSNGITGWTPFAGTLSVSNQKLSITGDGTGQYIRGQQQTDVPSNIGNKIYVKAKLTVTNAMSTRIMCQISGTLGDPVTVLAVDNPIENQSYDFSGIVQLPANFQGNIRIQFWHYYADSIAADGKVMEVENVTVVDLSKSFGYGHEPTQTEVDSLMSIVGGWFDGVLTSQQKYVNWLRKILATDVENALDNKVDKVLGKGLSTNDYTDSEKAQVAKIPQIEDDVNSLVIGQFGDGFVTEKMISDEFKKTTKELSNVTRPHIITLIGGQDDETPSPSLSLNTVEPDLVNFKIGDRGWKVNVLGSTGHQVEFVPDSVPMALPKVCAVGAWIYVEDGSKLTNVRINFYNDATGASISSYPSDAYGSLKTGWNFLRWSFDYPNIPIEYGSIHKIRLTGASTGATSYTIGHVWVECSEKAQILFIHDGGYRNFYSYGYPDLKARGIPVTWAIQPKRIIDNNSLFITEEQADILANENNNSMSFHSWDGSPTSGLTASELRAETMKSLKWLRRKGYTGGMFRAAFTQNTAPEHAAVRDLLLGYRRVSNGSRSTIMCHPFPDRYDVNGIWLHQFNNDLDGMTALFERVKKYNGLLVCYTHSVNEAGGIDMTPALWDRFLSEIDTGQNEGWLEGVTFEQLIAKSGFKFRRGFGDEVVEYYDELGELQTTRLP